MLYMRCEFEIQCHKVLGGGVISSPLDVEYSYLLISKLFFGV